ncbi:MAG: hypothetical protein AAF570_08845, partial [Bacteroidota bacterium]
DQYGRYGGSDLDWLNRIVSRDDGLFWVAGFSASTDHFGPLTRGNWDALVGIVDEDGQLMWGHRAGSSGRDAFLDAEVVGSEMVTVGYCGGADFETPENRGDLDVWVLSLSGVGNLNWSTVFGGSGADECFDLAATMDGGWMVAGRSASGDGDIGQNRGADDMLLMKMDANGVPQWHRTYGGSATEYGIQVQPNAAGYLLGGWTLSSDGEVWGHAGGIDIWILQLDAAGDTLWTRTYGGSGDAVLLSMKMAQNGDFFLAGFTENEGDEAGGKDVVLMKCGANGEVLWQEKYGGSADDVAFYMEELSDGRLLMSGYTASSDGDIKRNGGGQDAWLLWTDANGQLLGESTRGQELNDLALHFCEDPEGGFRVAGMIESDREGVPVGGELGDAWTFKWNFE